MLKSKMRLLGVSALVGAGLIAGPADAYNARLGGVDIQIDTSLSIGASWKMKDTESIIWLWVMAAMQICDHP